MYSNKKVSVFGALSPGYTSFVVEVSAVKETHIDEMDLNMYRIIPAPPKWDLQEYIVTYLKEKDERYLAWFLHYYEKTLNKNIQSYMRQFFMQEHFADLKQAYIAGLLKALSKYTPDGGAPSFPLRNTMWNEKSLIISVLCGQDLRYRALQNMQSSVKQ